MRNRVITVGLVVAAFLALAEVASAGPGFRAAQLSGTVSINVLPDGIADWLGGSLKSPCPTPPPVNGPLTRWAVGLSLTFYAPSKGSVGEFTPSGLSGPWGGFCGWNSGLSLRGWPAGLRLEPSGRCR